MKIVVNDCYGGFGLSGKAVARLVEMDSDLIHSFPASEGYGRGDSFEYEGYTLYKYSSVVTKDGIDYSASHDERAHPDLISVVEELGDEVNDSCSQLAIVEIPDDVEWMIQEYDGVEWVAEKHRVWHP